MASAVSIRGFSPGGLRLHSFRQLKARRAAFFCTRGSFPVALPVVAYSSSRPRRSSKYVPQTDEVGDETFDESPLIVKVARGPLNLLQQITPVLAIKWAVIAAMALTAFRFAYGIFFSPKLWTYCSHFFIIWPRPVAVTIGLWSIFLALPVQYNKQKRPHEKEQDQVFILMGAFTWLILVPLGIRHGYIQGWPLTLYIFYLYFFLAPAIVKLRQYGELNPKAEDTQWSSVPSKAAQVVFGTAVLASHWIAAYEAPHLLFSWNWQWPSCLAVFMLGIAYSLHYLAWYFLVKYSDPQVRPVKLVIFGPYRFLRHPIYTSYMLVFAGFCIALRAYKTAAFLVLASLYYYDQRARIEEKKLEEAFGKENFKVYLKQTKYKFFPLLY